MTDIAPGAIDTLKRLIMDNLLRLEAAELTVTKLQGQLACERANYSEEIKQRQFLETLCHQLKQQHRIAQESGADSEQRAMRFEYERDQRVFELRRIREQVAGINCSLYSIHGGGLSGLQKMVLAIIDAVAFPTSLSQKEQQ